MKKIIIELKFKDLEDEYISDNMIDAVELINNLKESIYKNMTKSNLNNILRGEAPKPPYIEYINKIDFIEYVKPLFEEIYPNKKHITNNTTLQKWYNRIITDIIDHQFDNLEY